MAYTLTFSCKKGFVQRKLFPVQRCCSWQGPADGTDFWQTTHHFKGWMVFIYEGASKCLSNG